MDYDPRLGVTSGTDTLKYAADIIEKTHQIRENDVIKFFALQIEVLGRHASKFEVRVPGSGKADHLGRDINTQAAPRGHRRQQISRSTSNFENPRR